MKIFFIGLLIVVVAGLLYDDAICNRKHNEEQAIFNNLIESNKVLRADIVSLQSTNAVAFAIIHELVGTMNYNTTNQDTLNYLLADEIQSISRYLHDEQTGKYHAYPLNKQHEL